jgi:NitT/TauT family transport system ATP-binding protein
MPGDTALEVRVATKEFVAPGGRRQIILHDIHLAGRPGEVIALLGRSGIGKSTLLRIVLGLDSDFRGEVRVPPGSAGVVFQDPRLLPWLTVADNLRLVTPRPPSDARIDDLLDRCGIAGVADHLPSALSLGMARRVALARALAVDPLLLVLDEPFASLDPLLGATLANRVAEYARTTSAIVLLATHEIEHALTIADRIYVLSGRPATATAVTVPAREDPAAIARLRADLLRRFAFLATPATT